MAAKESDAGGGAPEGAGLDALGKLLAGGAELLMNLSRAIAQQNEPGTGAAEDKAPGGVAGSLIERDEATGNSYLKIPLPQPEVLNQVISGLGAILSGLGKRTL